jgi:hypothetical protein
VQEPYISKICSLEKRKRKFDCSNQIFVQEQLNDRGDERGLKTYSKAVVQEQHNFSQHVHTHTCIQTEEHQIVYSGRTLIVHLIF